MESVVVDVFVKIPLIRKLPQGAVIISGSLRTMPILKCNAAKELIERLGSRWKKSRCSIGTVFTAFKDAVKIASFIEAAIVPGHLKRPQGCNPFSVTLYVLELGHYVYTSFLYMYAPQIYYGNISNLHSMVLSIAESRQARKAAACTVIDWLQYVYLDAEAPISLRTISCNRYI